MSVQGGRHYRLLAFSQNRLRHGESSPFSHREAFYHSSKRIILCHDLKESGYPRRCFKGSFGFAFLSALSTLGGYLKKKIKQQNGANSNLNLFTAVPVGGAVAQ